MEGCYNMGLPGAHRSLSALSTSLKALHSSCLTLKCETARRYVIYDYKLCVRIECSCVGILTATGLCLMCAAGG